MRNRTAWIGIGVAFAAIVAFIVWDALKPDRMSAAPLSSASVASASCDETWSSLIYGTAKQQGIIQDAQVEPSGIIVLVDRQRFERLGLEAQTKIAVATDCGIAGDSGHVRSVRFRTSPGTPDIARFDADDLMRARAKQFP